MGLLILVLGGASGGARAADPVPFFKADPKPLMLGPVPLFQPEARPVVYGPVLPDPAAPECGIDDQPCIERHDARVLTLASSSHAREECAESTRPESCYDAYDMMAGDFVPRPDPILADPCTWVVLIDRGVATLSSRKLGMTKRLLNRGWKARTFIGACDVKAIAPEQPVVVIPMPAWTVRSGQPVRARTQSRTPRAAPPAPRVVTVVPVPLNPALARATSVPTAPTVATPSAPAASVPSAPAISVASAPALAAPSRPAAAAPLESPLAPPAPTTGPPGVTQPPPFARAPALSDAQNSPPTPPR